MISLKPLKLGEPDLQLSSFVMNPSYHGITNVQAVPFDLSSFLRVWVPDCGVAVRVFLRDSPPNYYHPRLCPSATPVLLVFEVAKKLRNLIQVFIIPPNGLVLEGHQIRDAASWFPLKSRTFCRQLCEYFEGPMLNRVHVLEARFWLRRHNSLGESLNIESPRRRSWERNEYLPRCTPPSETLPKRTPAEVSISLL